MEICKFFGSILTSLIRMQKQFPSIDFKLRTIAIETDKDHIHFLLNYDTMDRVCDIVKTIKQETYYLWQNYNSFLSKQYWKKKYFSQMICL